MTVKFDFAASSKNNNIKKIPNSIEPKSVTTTFMIGQLKSTLYDHKLNR